MSDYEDYNSSEGWLSIRSKCKTLLVNIAEMIKKRDKILLKQGGGSSSEKLMKLRGKIRKKMSKVELKISNLEDNIDYLDITDNEKKNREDQMAQMRQSFQDLERSFSREGRVLSEALQGKRVKKERWKMGEEPERIRRLDNEEVLGMQNQVLVKQKRNISQILVGLEREEEKQKDIGDELGEHKKLLGDLEDEVDTADYGLTRTTRAINLLKKPTVIGCGLVVCSAVLFLLLVGIIVLVIWLNTK